MREIPPPKIKQVPNCKGIKAHPALLQAHLACIHGQYVHTGRCADCKADALSRRGSWRKSRLENGPKSRLKAKVV